MGNYMSTGVKSLCAFGHEQNCCCSSSGPVKRKQPPDFGKDMREEEFDLWPDWAYLNHGGYGMVPVKVKEAQFRFITEMEQTPDIWFWRAYSAHQREQIVPIAAFLGCKPEDSVLTQNTTTGINNIMKSLQWEVGDGIIINNWSHRSMKNLVNFVKQYIQPGVEIITLTHTLPILDKEEIITQYRESMEQNPNIKLALIDHISSVPCILFPVKELSALCHQYNVISLIDGAHVPGQVLNLNIEDIGADFYVGNVHKWVYSSRGSAIQWMSPDFHTNQSPAITSTVFDQPWPEDFLAQGTRDGTSILTCEAALAFYNYIGVEAAYEYITELSDQAQDMLAAAWGTEVMPVPQDMVCPFMRIIRVPEIPFYPATREGCAKTTMSLEDYQIFALMVNMNDVPGMWVRICVNVYCTWEDMERLRDAILDMQTWSPNDPRVIKRHLSQAEINRIRP